MFIFTFFFFYQMVPVVQVWPIKQILLYSCFLLINDNCVGGCQSVVCMCVIHFFCVCRCVCVLVIFEREKLICKSKIQSLCAPVEFCWHPVGKICYCTQTNSYRKLIILRSACPTQIWNTNYSDAWL